MHRESLSRKRHIKISFERHLIIKCYFPLVKRCHMKTGLATHLFFSIFIVEMLYLKI